MTQERWAVMPAWIIDNHLASLDASAMKVYLYLSRWSNRDGVAWHSQQRIADACGVAPRTVVRALKKLVDMGAVQVNEQNNAGRRSTNRYTLDTIGRKPGGTKLPNQVTPESHGRGDQVTPMSPDQVTPMSPKVTTHEVTTNTGVAVDTKERAEDDPAASRQNENNSRDVAGEYPTLGDSRLSRPEGFRNGKWMPSDEAVRSAKDVQQFENIQLSIAKYSTWCERNKRQKDSGAWLSWFIEDERRALEAERKRKAEERREDVWHRVAD